MAGLRYFALMLSTRGAFLLFSVILSGVVGAQTFFEHLARADGLPGDQVLALYEDRDGFIWIGTESGLARHEGVRIHTWFHDRKDPRSLPNNTVWDITGDEHGRVWIATDHGLCGYDARTGGFDRVFITRAYHDPTSANRIHHVLADGHGLLWLGTEDGVHTVSIDGVPHEVSLPDGGDRIEGLTNVSKAMSLSADTIHHGLWIGASPGLIFRDIRGSRYLTRSTPEHPFTCLNDPKAQRATPDGTGGLWYFTLGTNELLHLDAHGLEIARYPVTAPGNKLPSPQFLGPDRKGHLWMSTWGQELKVLNIAHGTWSAVEHADDVPWSITSANAKSWLEDRDGRIWIGTYEGLNVIDPAQADLAAYLMGPPGHRSEVSSIAPVDDRHLLVGTAGAGAVLLDRVMGTQRQMLFRGTLSDTSFTHWVNYIECISRDRSGWLLGTYHGLVRVDTTFGRTERPPGELGQGTRPRYSAVRFIEEDAEGRKWIGMARSGLYRVDPTGAVEFCDSLGGVALPSRKLLSCAMGPEGTWLGFNDGAGSCRIQNDRIVERVLNEADSTGATYGVVNALARDTNGTLYIGTLMGGLGVRDPGTGSITWSTRSDGLTGDRIEELVLDHDGGLWIRTDDGLCRFDRGTQAIDRIDLPASMRSLGPLSAIALDSDGSLLCAYGPLLIDRPASSMMRATAPDVKLTALRFAGQALTTWDPDSVIELEHDARTLTLEYGARSFFNGQAVRFAYRLADLDSNWRNLGITARLDLNDLPVGEHRLQLRANSGGSAWTPHPLTLSVRVLPPFWSTWWFRGCLLLGIGAAFYFFVRGYVQERLREQREGMEREQAVLAERVRIAGDMHDDLGAGLSALKLKSEMALRVEKDPVKREQLGTLANTAGELIGSMRQIIWTMNGDQASVEDLVVYTTSYARNYCEQNALVADVQAKGPWPPVQLSTEQRRNVFLVVKEALHNVVKHAHAGRVIVSMEWSNGLIVEVVDNGVGLSRGAQGGQGNGLRNMEKRIHALGGTLALNGAAGGGTSIRFQVNFPPAPNQGSIATGNKH